MLYQNVPETLWELQYSCLTALFTPCSQLVWFLYFCISMGDLGSVVRVGRSITGGVGGSIPWWQSTSLPRPRCPWVRHRTPMLPGRCEWLPTECVSLCMCVFNRCQPGWVKCGGVILCISCDNDCMTIILIINKYIDKRTFSVIGCEDITNKPVT